MTAKRDKYLDVDLSLFRHDGGRLYWTDNRNWRVKAGDRAGSVDMRGYRVIFSKGKLLLEHRIIFLMLKGYLPEFIDHINGDPADNRIENLRGATYSQNGQNKKMLRNNTTGVKNVTLLRGKYQVTLNINGKDRWFGVHESLEFAELVAHEAREKYHGEYANDGKRL